MKMDIKLLVGGLALLLGGVAWFFFATPEPTAVQPRVADPVAGIKIVAFGDSLTAGYGLMASEAYPAQLESRLEAEGYSVTVINAGVSGETTRGNLERVEFIKLQKPDLVLLGIGGNDALRALPLSETRANISATIEALQAGENPPLVVLLQMQAPLNAGFGYKQSFDALYEELAEQYRIRLVPFLTTELFFDADNKLGDGIHYNQVGYQKVVEMYLLPEVREVLDAMEGE